MKKPEEQLIARIRQLEKELKACNSELTTIKQDAEKKHKEQNQFLQSIYDGTESALFVIEVTPDKDFRFEGLNPAHEKLTGLKSDEIKGKTPEQLAPFIPEEATKIIRNNYQRCLDAENSIQYEEMIPMGGMETWWLTKLTPLKNDTGRIYRIIGSSVSINELKKTQQELQIHKDSLEYQVEERTKEFKEKNKEYLALNEELRAMNEEMQLQKERFLTVFDNHPEILYVVDPDTYEVLFVNKYFQNLLGHDPTGKVCYKEFQGFEKPCTFCTNDIILKNKGKPYTWEYYNPMLKKHFYITDQIVKWPDGRDVRFELAVDMTQQKKLEAEIKQKSDEYKSLYDEYLAQNEELEANNEELALRNDELQALNSKLHERIKELNYIIHASDLLARPELIKDDLIRELVDLIPPAFQFPEKTCAMIVIDGKEHKTSSWTDTKVIIQSDIIIDDISIGKIVVACTDNSQKSADTFFLAEEQNLIDTLSNMLANYFIREKAWKEAEYNAVKYHSLYDNAPDMYVSVSPDDGIIIECNDTLLENTGYQRKEVIGQPVFMMYHKNSVKQAKKTLAEFKETGFIKDRELILRRKNGSQIDVSLNVKAIRDEHEKISYSISSWRDITERKALNRKIQKALKDLKRSNQELEQFAYVASHDLQEPLRMVSSFTQLLAKRYKDKLDDDAGEFINYAVDGANRMQRLINDLLSYSRITTRGKDFQETDTHEVLGRVLVNLQMSVQESGAMITNDQLPVVRADENQLIQLFQNLIQNAIKFRRDENPRIHISAKKDNNQWLFAVTDNGIGIDNQFRERIFVIFQRLHSKEKFKGTGIGLAICKRIVERHGGKIWIESKPGQGTTFYFTIKQ